MTRPTLERMRAALEELLAAATTSFPNEEHGQDAQEAWANRIHAAEEQARELISTPIQQSDEIHSCSYFCDRPECIKAQRDELRGMFEKANATQSNPAVADGGMPELPHPEPMTTRWTELELRAIHSYARTYAAAQSRRLERTEAMLKDRVREIDEKDVRISELEEQSSIDRDFIGQYQQQIAELEAAEKDAARYRWLKAKRDVLLLTGFFGNACLNRTIEEVDALIDSALTKQELPPMPTNIDWKPPRHINWSGRAVFASDAERPTPTQEKEG
jgi:hypothetical protein